MPLDDLDAIDPEQIFLVQLSDYMWQEIRSAEEQAATATHFRVFPGEGAHSDALAAFVTRLDAYGYYGDYSFDVYNDDYLQMPPETVAARALRAAEWLGETVLRRALPVPNIERLRRPPAPDRAADSRKPMPTIEYRRLGASGLEVSPLCLGTMTFGDRTDAATAQRIVDSALDAGVNFIDTADAYGEWRVRAHRRPRDQARSRRHWILATKVGNVLTARPHDGGLSRRWLLAACDDSLARLGTDHIDIYYLHRDDPDTPIAETVGAHRRPDPRRQDPLFRRLELPRLAHRRDSSTSARRRAFAPPVVCQPYYNLLNRMPEVEVLPACDHYGIGVAPYSPLARGVLTGQVPRRRQRARRTRARRSGTRGSWRPSSAPSRSRSPQKLAQARAEDRAHAGAVRARLAVGQRDRDLDHRRAAHVRAVAGLPVRARHRVVGRRRGAGRLAGAARAIRRRPATPTRATRRPGASPTADPRRRRGGLPSRSGRPVALSWIPSRCALRCSRWGGPSRSRRHAGSSATEPSARRPKPRSAPGSSRA